MAARTVAIFHPQPVDAQKALIPIQRAIGEKAIAALTDRDAKCDSQTPRAAAIVAFLREHPSAIVAQRANDDSSPPRYLTAEIRTDFDVGAFVYGILRLFNEPLWTLGHWDCARLYVVDEHVADFRKMMHVDEDQAVASTTKGKAGRKQSVRVPIKRALLELYPPNGIPEGIKDIAVMAAVAEHLKLNLDEVSRYTVKRAIDDHKELAQNSSS